MNGANSFSPQTLRVTQPEREEQLAAKRAVARLSLLAIPVAVLYVVVGWESPAAAFKPVAAIRTLISPDERTEQVGADTSTRARDIENFNLSQTLREYPLGTGLGQPYREHHRGHQLIDVLLFDRFVIKRLRHVKEVEKVGHHPCLLLPDRLRVAWPPGCDGQVELFGHAVEGVVPHSPEVRVDPGPRAAA